MQWTKEERTFAVESYFSSGRSIITVQRAFRNHFNIAPVGRVLIRNRFFYGWTPLEKPVMYRKETRRLRTIRTLANTEQVRQSILRSPKRDAAALRMSDRSVRRILHEELHFHPYKLAVVQKFNLRDFLSRKNAYEAVLDNMPHDTLVFFSDEAHFHLSGFVNKQNMRYWSSTNPRKLHEQPLHTERVTVWCGLSRICIIGPWCFEENGQTVTVISVRYAHMIEVSFYQNLKKWIWGMSGFSKMTPQPTRSIRR
ncbi:hypothetical protein X975_18569, partial [Stegodyphus mimosarum]